MAFCETAPRVRPNFFAIAGPDIFAFAMLRSVFTSSFDHARMTRRFDFLFAIDTSRNQLHLLPPPVASIPHLALLVISIAHPETAQVLLAALAQVLAAITIERDATIVSLDRDLARFADVDAATGAERLIVRPRIVVRPWYR